MANYTDNVYYLNDLESGGALNLLKGTGTEAAGAVTVSAPAGLITTSVLTNGATGASQSYSITLTNTSLIANSYLMVTKGAYSGTAGAAGVPEVEVTSVTAGSAVIKITNVHATQSLNGTLKLYFNIV